MEGAKWGGGAEKRSPLPPFLPPSNPQPQLKATGQREDLKQCFGLHQLDYTILGGLRLKSQITICNFYKFIYI